MTKYELDPEASLFHNMIRDILLVGSFKGLMAFQEVPLRDLVDDNNYMRIDWFIEPLNVCIELHGAQHYKQTNFGYKPKIESNLDWISHQLRDNIKRRLLEDNGYFFIEIPYKDRLKLNEQYLTDKINEVINGRES